MESATRYSVTVDVPDPNDKEVDVALDTEAVEVAD